MLYIWQGRRRQAAVVLFAVLMSGCALAGFGFTNISDILARPEAYAGREIRVRGKVTGVIKLPFVLNKLYTVRDSTGEITVRTNGAAPMNGAEIRASGTLDTLAAIGDQNIGLHLREVERW